MVRAQVTVSTRSAPRADTRVLDSLLATRVTIDVHRVSLRRALDIAAASAGVPLQYHLQTIDSYSALITTHLSNVPLRAVLEQLLAGTALTVAVDGASRLAIVASDVVPTPAAGVIAGTVVNAKTQKPLVGAAVILDDTTRHVRTDENGKYQFANVVPGTHRITTRFIGFSRYTQLVTVADRETVIVNVALAPSVNTLDQVVVTATGAQRYRELGHVVSTINADSLVKEAPITSLSELLTARVPGLQVLTSGGGTVGGNVALRLRGQTTANLDPQPIIIVDGVRYKNTNMVSDGYGTSQDARPFNAEPRSPLNDLNVNDIETVEVVKGPSASTLYGPDAANGVIVITTKHGKAGKPEWHVYAYPDLSTESTTNPRSPNGYRAWGHDPSTGQLYPGQCSLVYQYSTPQQCVLDSITVVPTANATPEYSVIAKRRPQWHSGTSVSGGVDSFTYFLSGNYDAQTGALRLSPFIARVLQEQLGTSTLSDALKTPNAQHTAALHASISSQLNPISTIMFSAGYTQATQRAIDISSVYGGTYGGGVIPPGIDTSDVTQVSQYLPTNAALRTTEQQVHRLTATVGGVLHPVTWLVATANVGTDLDGTIDRGIEPAGVEGEGFGGIANDFRRDNTGRSVNLGLTATARPSIWSFRTSLGTQYTYTKLDGLNTNGTGLAPGSTSISTATSVGTQQIWSETASLGTYVEEVLGVNDRLFLTGSLRYDGSTSFGDTYRPRPFPKIGASWIVSDEPFVRRLALPGITELRFRYSYGASSRYPVSGMKFGVLEAAQTFLNGQPYSVFTRRYLANPVVRPERTREAEYGTDLTMASNVRIGLTWYTRRTNDQLSVIGRPDYFLPQWANIGDLAAHGMEATLGARMFDTKMASFDLNATYAFNTNTVLSTGSASQYQDAYGSFVVGAPLDASFGQTIVGVADTVGGVQDGVILPNEVVLSPVHYLGVFFAPKMYTVTPVLTLFGAHVRVSTLFDRQTGGIQRDVFSAGCGNTGLCLAPYLKTTPLLTQAKYASGNPGSFIVSSNFTRWRELSVTGDLPQRLRERLWLSRASVSIQVRNLALWTNYKGPDPESVPGLGTVGLRSGLNGAIGIPLDRSWALRFDVSP